MPDPIILAIDGPDDTGKNDGGNNGDNGDGETDGPENTGNNDGGDNGYNGDGAIDQGLIGSRVNI